MNQLIKLGKNTAEYWDSQEFEDDIAGIEKKKKDIDVCLNEIDGEPFHDVPQQSNASKI